MKQEVKPGEDRGRIEEVKDYQLALSVHSQYERCIGRRPSRVWFLNVPNETTANERRHILAMRS